MSQYRVVATYIIDSDASEEEIIEAFDQDAGEVIQVELDDSEKEIEYTIESVDSKVEVLEY